MITATALNRITDFLPALDFGKLWSLLKVDAPVRPIPPKWRHRSISWVLRDANDHEGVLGVVYSSPDGQRLIFHCTESTSDVREDNTRYLTIPPMDYVDTATRVSRSKRKGIGFIGLSSDIEGKEDKTKTVSLTDRGWVEHCLNPDKSTPAFIDQLTLS